MVKTQIQLPDALYREAKRIAHERELSFAEVVRRGIEYVTRIYPPLGSQARVWRLPPPHRLGAFKALPGEWRSLANE